MSASLKATKTVKAPVKSMNQIHQNGTFKNKNYIITYKTANRRSHKRNEKRMVTGSCLPEIISWNRKNDQL